MSLPDRPGRIARSAARKRGRAKRPRRCSACGRARARLWEIGQYPAQEWPFCRRCALARGARPIGSAVAEAGRERALAERLPFRPKPRRSVMDSEAFRRLALACFRLHWTEYEARARLVEALSTLWAPTSWERYAATLPRNGAGFEARLAS